MEAKLVPIDLLVPSNRNPRARTKPDPALVASVRALGIIEPIVVRPLPDGTYEILAGERRYRAALEAGLSEVPVVVREAGNREALEVALAENVARKDLNAFEAMEGVLRTIEEAGFSQEEAVMILKRALHSLRRTRGEEAPEVEVVRKILEPTGISPYSLIRYEPLLNVPREVRRALMQRGIPLGKLLRVARSPEALRLMEERLEAWRSGKAPTIPGLSPEETLAASFDSVLRTLDRGEEAKAEERRKRLRERPRTDVEKLVWSLSDLVEALEERGLLNERMRELLEAFLDEAEETLYQANQREAGIDAESFHAPLRERLERLRAKARGGGA
ncbi:ParB/RepB/Spo0J family partition protein [Thermus thermophilus]|nr:ParB/RepB/Spo0J family partition protein [Thermus thermophilus]